jgi:hypothetical protein
MDAGCVPSQLATVTPTALSTRRRSTILAFRGEDAKDALVNAAEGFAEHGLTSR